MKFLFFNIKKDFQTKSKEFLQSKLCHYILGFSLIIALLPNSQVAYSADWPTFRGNNQRTGFVKEQTYPPLTRIWDFHIQGDVISSPVVYDGKVYVGARSGSVYALDAKTGEHIWDYSTDDWVDATPAVYGAAVFFPSRDGYLYAIDKDNGNLLWRAELGAPSVSSPLYFDGKIFVGCGMPENKLKVFSASGNFLWQYQAGQPIMSSPSTDGNFIYFGANDGKVYAISPEGGLKWSVQTIGSFDMSAVPVSSGAVYALPGHDEKKLYALNFADGSQINLSETLNVTGEAEVASPVIDENNVYFALGSSPETVYGYKRNSFETIWASSPTLGNTSTLGILSSPAMANEIMYAGTADGRLVAISSSGAAVSEIILSTSAFSSPAISNGMVYLGRQGGRLMAYRASKIAAISSPGNGDIFNSSVSIAGYIENPDLEGYTLEYGEGENPSSWNIIVSSSLSSGISGDVLSVWNTLALSNGIYALKLTVNENSPSGTDNTAKILIRINHPPGPPSDLNASDVPSDNGNKIQLSWTASTSTISEYRIYRKTSGDFSFIQSLSSSSLSYVDATAVTGTTFTYIIRSYDGYMESGDSNEATAYSVNNDPSSDNTAPAAINDLAATQGIKGGEVNLSWTAPGNDANIGTAAYYDIRYSTYYLVDFDSMNIFNSSRGVGGEAGFAENEIVKGLFGGTTYYFAIKTVDFNSNISAVSNYPSARAQIDFDPPAAPSELKVEDTPGDHGGSLTLTWKLSPDDGQGDGDVYGYKIYRRIKTGKYISSSPYALTGAGVSKYEDGPSSAATNVKYFYKVAAFDSTNDSPMSNESFGISADNWRFLDASNGGTVRLADGTEVIIPKNAVSQNDNILVMKVDTQTFSPSLLSVKSAGAKPTNIIYEIKFENSSTKLNGMAEITLPYSDSDIQGLEEENLRMYTYFGGKWVMFNNSEVLMDQNKVKAATTHFSYFRIMQYVPSGALMSYEKVYTYPNPAKGDSLTFKFYVADKSYVTIDVYNVAGEKVAKLEKENCPAGIVSEIDWDIRNVASGVYVYKVEARSASGSKEIIKKLAIIH